MLRQKNKINLQVSLLFSSTSLTPCCYFFFDFLLGPVHVAQQSNLYFLVPVKGLVSCLCHAMLIPVHPPILGFLSIFVRNLISCCQCKSFASSEYCYLCRFENFLLQKTFFLMLLTQGGRFEENIDFKREMNLFLQKQRRHFSYFFSNEI